MALLLLKDAYSVINRTDINADEYILEYSEDTWQWDTAQRVVVATLDHRYDYTGGYQGAPPPPQDYSRPTTDVVDAYTVPSVAGQPGYDADPTTHGRYRTVYHDGAGGVTFDDGDVCDLALRNLVGRAPTVAGGTGSIEFDASTSAAWVSVTLWGGPAPTYPLVQVAPGRLAITGVAPGPWGLSAEDARGCFVGLPTLLTVVVPATPPPVVLGCTDEEASNFNPLATQSDGTCRYVPRWIGLWAPGGMPVTVAPAAGAAFVTAEIWAGFPVGHPLASARPEVLVATARATVSPRTGLAVVDAAPYLRDQVGALQSDGSRRLDLNSPTALSDDLFVGFRVVVTGITVARGYALNSVLPEAALDGIADGAPLTPFGAVLPQWADYPMPTATLATLGRYGQVLEKPAGYFGGLRALYRPCPANGLPVAWLTQDGGFGHWVFAGKHNYGDEIGEAQGYIEAGTNERRTSSRAPSYRTIEASTGPFAGRELAEGLRTLRRAVQAWYKPGAEWLPITQPSGAFPAYREGVNKYDFSIKFSEARPVAVQGQ